MHLGVRVGMCHGTFVEVRGQLVGVGSLPPPYGFPSTVWVQVKGPQAIGLGSRHLLLVSHRTGPTWALFYFLFFSLEHAKKFLRFEGKKHKFTNLSILNNHGDWGLSLLFLGIYLFYCVCIAIEHPWAQCCSISLFVDSKPFCTNTTEQSGWLVCPGGATGLHTFYLTLLWYLLHLRWIQLQVYYLEDIYSESLDVFLVLKSMRCREQIILLTLQMRETQKDKLTWSRFRHTQDERTESQCKAASFLTLSHGKLSLLFICFHTSTDCMLNTLSS